MTPHYVIHRSLLASQRLLPLKFRRCIVMGMRFGHYLAVLSLLLTPLAAGNAQTGGEPTTTVRAGRLLDTKGQKIAQDQLIVVQKGRIARILPESASALENAHQGGQVIDLSGFDVFPGSAMKLLPVAFSIGLIAPRHFR